MITLEAIITGVIGSLLGAMIVGISQFGFSFNKKRKEKIKERKQKEENKWIQMEFGIRQGITNQYLFEILKFLFLGNFFWVFPEFIKAILSSGLYNVVPEPQSVDSWISISCTVLSLVFFYYGFGKILRYIYLRKLDDKKS
jgi:accessory gene regulator protein AgrB